MITKNTIENSPKVKASVDARVMFSRESLEVIHLEIKPGEVIPFHQNQSDVLFCGIEGKPWLYTKEQKLFIEPGETVFVSKEEERMWQNNSDKKCRLLVIKITNL